VNILLINHYAGSDRMGMEYRPFHFAREWLAEGHNVTILAADFSHLRNRQPTVHGDLEVSEEQGVRFRWLRTNRYGGNGAERVLNMSTFVGKLLLRADRIAREERPDLVICSSTYPLDIFPGAYIARKAGARLVFEVHDLWPLTPILLGGYSRRHPYIRVLQAAEDWAYRNADVVVSILPNALEYMIGRGLEPRKFVHIPNGIPPCHADAPGENRLPRATMDLLERERARGRFLIGFAGTINPNMAVETLLSAAIPLRASGVSFFIAGDGSNAKRLRDRAECLAIDNFHMLGRVPKASVQDFLSRMDALAIPWHRLPLYRFGVSPNKVFDYMLSGKPILQAGDASNDLLSEARCGFTVAPEDPEAFADAVLRLRALPAEERRLLGANGRRFVLEKHDCRVLARRFLREVAPQHTDASAAVSRVTAGEARASTGYQAPARPL
jgi:glycosyltransferase involved in cell wall biosynthesis